MKIYVTFCAEGDCINVFNYYNKMKNFTELVKLVRVSGRNLSYQVSTQLGVDMFRVAIVHGIIDPGELELFWSCGVIPVDIDGRGQFPSDYPWVGDEIFEDLMDAMAYRAP